MSAAAAALLQNRDLSIPNIEKPVSDPSRNKHKLNAYGMFCRNKKWRKVKELKIAFSAMDQLTSINKRIAKMTEDLLSRFSSIISKFKSEGEPTPLMTKYQDCRNLVDEINKTVGQPAKPKRRELKEQVKLARTRLISLAKEYRELEKYRYCFGRILNKLDRKKSRSELSPSTTDKSDLGRQMFWEGECPPLTSVPFVAPLVDPPVFPALVLPREVAPRKKETKDFEPDTPTSQSDTDEGLGTVLAGMKIDKNYIRWTKEPKFDVGQIEQIQLEES